MSVIMPVFNMAQHVRAAIDSVLGQTFADFEIVVVDDGSTDATSDILASYTDPRVRVIQHARTEGISAARNHAVAAARAPLLALLDADDVSMPDRLALQVEYMNQHPDIDLLGTEYIRIDDAGQPVRPGIPRPTDDAHLKWSLLFANQFTNSSVMLRRSAFDRTGGYRLDRPYAEDYGLWTRVAQFGRMATLPAVLVQYRENPNGVSQTRGEIQREIVRRISADMIQRVAPPSFDLADVALLQTLIVADMARLTVLPWSSVQTRQLNKIAGGLGALLNRFCSVYVPDASEWPAVQRWARGYVARRLLRTASIWSGRHATQRFSPLPRQLCAAALRIDATLLRDGAALTAAARAMLRRGAVSMPRLTSDALESVS